MGGSDSSLPENLRAELLGLAIDFHDLSAVLGPITEFDPQVEKELRALGYLE